MDNHSTVNARFFHKILVVDIETVPCMGNWDEVNASMQKHWTHKASFLNEALEPGKVFEQRAGIYAEFGKIVCIGLGFVNMHTAEPEVRLKALKNDDEKLLLQSFIEVVQQFAQNNKDFMFCGHNIKEFDIPYICRRILIHQLPLPACLQLSGLKPWQVQHQDTLELWRFGDYKHYITLDLLATVLGVPSSKSDMDGSMVGQAYWQQQALDRIAKYCLDDVYTTTLVYMRLKGWTKALPIPVYV